MRTGIGKLWNWVQADARWSCSQLGRLSFARLRTPSRIRVDSGAISDIFSRTADGVLITGRDANGGPVTAVKLRPCCGQKSSRQSLPSQVRSGVLARPNIPSEIA